MFLIQRHIRRAEFRTFVYVVVDSRLITARSGETDGESCFLTTGHDYRRYPPHCGRASQGHWGKNYNNNRRHVYICNVVAYVIFITRTGRRDVFNEVAVVRDLAGRHNWSGNVRTRSRIMVTFSIRAYQYRNSV